MKKNIKKIASFLLATSTLLSVGACGLFEVEKDGEVQVKVYMPDGAPALALAKLMHEDTQDDGVEYFVVDAKTIATRVNAEDMEKNADICVMPITAASKLLGTGEKYKMLGLATQGNLFLISNKESVEITRNNLYALLGKKVLVEQMNEVPGLTLKATLDANNIAWQELKEGVTPSLDKVNLAASAASLEEGESFDCELVAEPAVSKRLANAAANYKVVADIQKLYGGENYGFPQAAIVAKSSLVEENGAFIRDFLAEVSLARSWLLEENAEAIYSAVVSHFEDEGKTPVFTKEVLSKTTLERCGVKFALALECKATVHGYLSELLKINGSAVKIPSEEFYWNGSLIVPN